MQGVPEQFEFPTDRAEFRTVNSRAGVELYRAHIVQYAFEPHTHEAFAFGTITSGVQRIRCNGNEHLAAPDSIVLMNSDALHTGRAETEVGWVYRMLYVEPDVLEKVTGEKGWWFPETVIDGDKNRAQRLSTLMTAIWQTQEPLAFDSLLYQLISEVRPYARMRDVDTQVPLHRFAHVLDYMHEHLDERIVLEDLATVAGLSPFHFLRQFQAQYDVTPHQMLMAKRLHTAKQLLATGLSPVEVAAAVGLTDQSHLNRTFVRRYGVTPARYRHQIYERK
jgi:AraC-like DNA-binding protein